MRLLALAAIAGCTTVGGGATRATVAPPASPRQALVRAIDSMVAEPAFRNAHWGILIVDPDRADTLYSLEAGKLFMPASNMKIITGAVALAQLGPDFRFVTTVTGRGPRRGGVLEGDLIVHGRGDPTWSDHMRTDAMIPLREMADSLASRGITRIAGRIVPGDDVFPGAIWGGGWSWDNMDDAFSAGVDELYFNEGFTRVIVKGGARPGDPAQAITRPARRFPALRVLAVTEPRPDSAAIPVSAVPARRSAGSHVVLQRDSSTGGIIVAGSVAPGDSVSLDMSYAEPARALIAAFSEALTDRGIVVAGALLPPTGTIDTLFAMKSPPLREIMPPLLKPSQNQIAEILLRTLGLERGGAGTADSGRKVAARQLTQWGASPDGYVIRDGSGLSRYDYLSPETIVRTLAAVRRDTAFRAFYDALPIAGVDGTIRNRMRGTPAEGNLHAKTGSIANARSLSGYVTTADGRTLLFSALCNNWTVPVRDVERVQDAIGVRLAGLTLGSSSR